MATALAPGQTKTLDDLRALGAAGRGLWLIYAIKFLESVAFFAVYNLIAVYLSEDLGYGDVSASGIAGAWLTTISLLTFMSGFVADSLGIRTALLVSVGSCLVGRLLITVSTAKAVALTGLFAMSWGVASMLPTMTAAVRAFTPTRSLSFGFSFFYVVMNVGAFVAPQTVSFFRKRFREPWHGQVAGVDVTMSSSQLVYAIATVATLLALVLALSVPEPPKAEGDAAKESPLAILRSVVSEKAFFRFMLLVSLLSIVQLAFQHAHLTWPKYTMRELGKDFPFASWWSLNPLLVIFLSPFVTAATKRFDPFKSIVAGAFVSSVSMLAMAVSTSLAASVVFIVVLSLGEAVWSPRLYEYTTVIAPKGREASYMGLSKLPLFVAKPVAAFSSGLLLARYCPETGERSSRTMWAILGLVTLAAPIAIVLLRKVIRPDAPPRDEGEPGQPAPT